MLRSSTVSQEGALDLVAYVEFKRNLKTVLRVHKAVLQQQRDFWRSLLSDHTKARSIQEGLREIQSVTEKAQQVGARWPRHCTTTTAAYLRSPYHLLPC